MNNFADSYQILYKDMMDCAIDVQVKSAALTTSMQSLHKCMEGMSELNKVIKCQSQEELYSWLSKALAGTGTFIA
jgi:hypothetical protein